MSRLKVDNIEARSGNNISMDDPLALKSYDTAGRDALTLVLEIAIYNTDTGTIDYYNGSAWVQLSASSFAIEYLTM